VQISGIITKLSPLKPEEGLENDHTRKGNEDMTMVQEPTKENWWRNGNGTIP